MAQEEENGNNCRLMNMTDVSDDACRREKKIVGLPPSVLYSQRNVNHQ